MGSKTPVVILMMVATLVCATIVPGLGALLPPTASFAQQEGTTLGEEEIFAGGIVSDVLDGGNNDDEDDQDATNTATEGSNQGQEVDQDDTSIFGDDTADLDDANVGASIGIPVTVQQEEEEAEEETPTPFPPQQEGDTTPPIITVPEDMVVEATNTEGAQVRYTVTAQDNVDGTATLDEENTLTQDDVGGDITISCNPPSGSTFEIGDTEVECTATDGAGNIATEPFAVTVQDTISPDEEVTTIYNTGFIECNSNDGTPQQCDNPFRVTIETTSVLKVGVTVSPLHCSSTNFYVSVDGDEDTFGGIFIGRAGYSAIGDDTRTIPPYDFGTVESGSHTLDIWVEGIPGGCNSGFLGLWRATLTVITSEPVEEDTTLSIITVP